MKKDNLNILKIYSKPNVKKLGLLVSKTKDYKNHSGSDGTSSSKCHSANCD